MENLDFSANADQLKELAAYMASQINVPTIGIGGGYAPIGAIQFFDATVAPQDWLACDGTVYNIADYPQLADWYEAQHGSKNFYGGDGTTTFAVPDLQGEFLRGTGTNSHANQGSGANVGEHQDGTKVPYTTAFENEINIYRNTDKSNNGPDNNTDSKIISSGNGNRINASTNSQDYPSSRPYAFTSRPTNTSFLICVKAVVAGEVYSTEERVVGTWIDGKPVYQKTIQHTFTGNTSTQNITIPHYITNLDRVVNISAFYANPENGKDYPITQLTGGGVPSNIEIMYAWAVMFSSITSDNILITMGRERQSGEVLITLQYIKTTD